MKWLKRIKNTSKRKHVQVADLQVELPGWDLSVSDTHKQVWKKEGQVCSLTYYPIPALVPFDLTQETAAKKYYTQKSEEMDVDLMHCALGYIGHVRTLATAIAKTEGEKTMYLGSYTFYFLGFSFILKLESNSELHADAAAFLKSFHGLFDVISYSDTLRSFFSH